MSTNRAVSRKGLVGVGRAIELSADLIARRPDLLAGQLVGRLFDEPALGDLRAGARASGTRAWLCPTTPGLRNPGDPLVRTVGATARVMALGPDDRTLVTGGADGALVWDLDRGGAPTRLVPTDPPLRRTTGSRLAEDGRTPVAVTEPAPVTALAVLGRTGEVAVGHGDDHDTVVLYDLDSGVARRTLVGRTEDPPASGFGSRGIVALAVTPDARGLVALGEDGIVRVWPLDEVAGPRELLRLAGGGSVAVHPDGGRVIVSSAPWPRPDDRAGDRPEGTVEVDPRSGAVLCTGPGLGAGGGAPSPGETISRAPTCLALTPDGRYVVAGYGDDHDSALVWSPGDAPAEVRAVSAHPAARGAMEGRGITAVAVTPDGTRFITGHNDGRLLVWAVDGGSGAVGLPGHPGPVHDVGVTADGTRVVSCGEDGVVIWDLDAASAEPWAPAALRHLRALTGAAVSADAGSAVVGSLHGDLLCWRRADRWRPMVEPSLPVLGVDVTADGTRLAAALNAAGASVGSPAGEAPRCLRVWDLDSGRELPGHRDPWHLQSVRLTPDGHWALAERRDGGVRLALLDPAGTASPRTVELEGDGWSMAAVSDDGERALCADWQRGEVAEVRLSPRRRRHRRAPPARVHTGGPISRMDASLDGERIAIIGADQCLEVWDLPSGRLVHRFTTRGRPSAGSEGGQTPDAPWVRDVAVSRDGRWAVTGTSDGWVELWDLMAGTLVADFKLDAPALAVNLEDTGSAVAILDGSGGVLRLESRGPSSVAGPADHTWPPAG